MNPAPDIQHAIDALALPGVLVGHRLIAPEDALALMAEEREAFAKSVDKVKRASGAARIVARALMQQLGEPPRALPRSASGAPVWPAGLIGSLSHDSRVAVAAMARRGGTFTGLGIDVEPAEPLDAKLLPMIATSMERHRIADNLLQAKVLFTIKEAVYKCVNPLDGAFLEHHDVEVDFASGTAATSTGRSVRFRTGLASHIVTLAFA